MKTYRVTVTLQYPAWDEQDGLTATVFARSKQDAIKRVRQRFSSEGVTHPEQGRKTFRAVIISDDTEN